MDTWDVIVVLLNKILENTFLFRATFSCDSTTMNNILALAPNEVVRNIDGESTTFVFCEDYLTGRTLQRFSIEPEFVEEFTKILSGAPEVVFHASNTIDGLYSFDINNPGSLITTQEISVKSSVGTADFGEGAEASSAKSSIDILNITIPQEGDLTLNEMPQGIVKGDMVKSSIDLMQIPSEKSIMDIAHI